MPASCLLHVNALDKRFGERVTASGVDLEIGNGEFFTMLGPSGSGKSTILRMIAGLEQPDGGRIFLDGKDVTELPPWRRELGMVFQQYANFPHMSVAQNVGYGLRRKALGGQATRGRIAELLQLVGLSGFEDRSVTRLSGGEQQRVAIARALAPRPRLLLLDEPLSALDEKIRRGMQAQLKDIQRATGTTFVYVTHDQEEALTMSDRVAVLNFGHLVQVDAPQTIFRRPKTKFVADFFRGSNLVEGRLVGRDGQQFFECAAFSVALPHSFRLPADPPCVAIRGEDMKIADRAAPGDVTFAAVLERIVYRGVYTDYDLRLADGQAVTACTTSVLDIAVGQSLHIAVRPEAIVPLHAEPA
ncbi:spermidine/putrescine transport system ATP-binding protein/putrescine transport system ATP-binding protein [Rhizobiales bacterium GAS191]|jgi:ABC-type Fe3+/spermidine/putrescine transport system ATPase subunit|nr:spermidine/putrescine transport system ATP-binding protein/putrescine transport system ATP-binding protein [Rhizobiales bacterium GAS113]SEE80674.1 spermidine/putrescine transport system ATP-binding protein/putrescine transport system ATP-binding protein [Rhizobiales bacterium GAS191]